MTEKIFAPLVEMIKVKKWQEYLGREAVNMYFFSICLGRSTASGGYHHPSVLQWTTGFALFV